MKTLKHVSSILLDVTKEKLWDLLTAPEWTEKYMYNCKVISDFKVGSSIEWKGEFQGVNAYLVGEVLAIEPKRFLKYSTIDPSYSDATVIENYIHVSYELREQNNSLLLTVVNETFDGSEERMKHVVQGWEGMVFPSISNLLNQGTKIKG